MKSFTRLTAILTLCAIAGLCVAGCNTFKGAGRDIQKGGEAVEDAADKNSK